MNDLIAGVLRLLLQAALLMAGLVVAAGLIVAVALLALVFGVRLLWAKLTGRPVLVFGLASVPQLAAGGHRPIGYAWHCASPR